MELQWESDCSKRLCQFSLQTDSGAVETPWNRSQMTATATASAVWRPPHEPSNIHKIPPYIGHVYATLQAQHGLRALKSCRNRQPRSRDSLSATAVEVNSTRCPGGCHTFKLTLLGVDECQMCSVQHLNVTTTAVNQSINHILHSAPSTAAVLSILWTPMIIKYFISKSTWLHHTTRNKYIYL